MAPRPTQSAPATESASSQLERLDVRRRGLLTQIAFMGLTGVALVFGAGGLDGAPLDLQFLFLAATGLFSLASVQVVDEALSILHSECPRCAGRFFGLAPDQLPSPLRKRCSHCGIALSNPTDRS